MELRWSNTKHIPLSNLRAQNLSVVCQGGYPLGQLRMGSAGPEVTCLEHRLAQLGFTITPDTAFRRDTQTALLQFEFYENLPQIGAVDNRTRKALGLVPA